MKAHTLLFGFLFMGSALLAQSPLTRLTSSTYDFGTDSYQRSTEWVNEYNELDQQVYRYLVRWIPQGDSTITSLEMDIRSTYHPDGSLASSLTQFYDRDRIR
ncbi:MAG: hypothetical protein AAFP02_17880, partial [Bacteroidota bacterium]